MTKLRLMAGVAFLATTQTLSAAPFTVSEVMHFDLPADWSGFSAAFNNTGAVVGDYWAYGWGPYGWLWRDGRFVTSGFPRGGPWEVNDADQVSGWSYYDPDMAYFYDGTSYQYVLHPFALGETFAAGRDDDGHYLWDLILGEKIYLNSLGDDDGFAAVNRSGTAVGHKISSPQGERAILADTSSLVQDLNDLIPPDCGWVLTSAADINDSGDVIGWGLFNGEEQAFLFADGEVTSLALFGAGTPQSMWINNNGLVLMKHQSASTVFINGTVYDLSDGKTTGGLAVRGGPVDLNDLNQFLTDGTTIYQITIDCAADLDGDGTVGNPDLGILLASYGTDAGGDIDRDGDTDQADLGALLGAYGDDCL